jgi:hypothetical protein
VPNINIPVLFRSKWSSRYSPLISKRNSEFRDKSVISTKLYYIWESRSGKLANRE